MVIKRYIIILLLGGLFGCKKDKQECHGRSMDNIRTLSRIYKQTVKRNDTTFNSYKDFISIIDEIDKFTNSLINRFGGFDPEYRQLMNGCYKGKPVLKFFQEYGLEERLREKMERSQKKFGLDNKLIHNYDFVLKEFYFGDSCVFTEQRISDTEISVLCLDLYLSQIYFLNALDNYLRSEHKENL